MLPPGLRGTQVLPEDDAFTLLACRRTTFEWSLRRHILEAGIAGVPRRRRGDGPAADAGRTAERHRRASARAGRPRGDAAGGPRDRRFGAALAAAGLAHGARRARAAQRSTAPCGIFYSSRFYSGRDGVTPPETRGPIAADLRLPQGTRSSPATARIFSLTLAASPDDAPLRAVTRAEAFTAVCDGCCRRFRVDRSDRSRRPVSDVHTLAGLRNTRRLVVEDGEPVALGIAAIGDALIHTNPIVGRGCSLAFVERLPAGRRAARARERRARLRARARRRRDPGDRAVVRRPARAGRRRHRGGRAPAPRRRSVPLRARGRPRRSAVLRSSRRPRRPDPRAAARTRSCCVRSCACSTCWPRRRRSSNARRSSPACSRASRAAASGRPASWDPRAMRWWLASSAWRLERRVQTLPRSALLRVPGISSQRIRPCRRQPIRRSHVPGRATAGRSAGRDGRSAQPSNQRPEDADRPQVRTLQRWGSRARVFSRVQQDVRKRRPHFPGRSECPMMVSARRAPLRDDRRTDSRPARARGQALRPASHGAGALRFDQQVDVIVLNRILDHTEIPALRHSGDRSLELLNEAQRPQGRDIPADAKRHQAGIALWELRAAAMPDARSRRGLSPSAFSLSTPAGRHLQAELELRATLRTLDCGYVFDEKSRKIWRSVGAEMLVDRSKECSGGS